GGVVPEIACRYHVEYIGYVLKQALLKPGISLDDIDLVAVTKGPGLVGALLVGVSLAKSLALTRNLPLVGVNHLKAHIWAAKMSAANLRLPFVGLVVSGGHTALIHVKSSDKMKLLGQTRDDAAGEAFDKAAKILKLGFPGGPAIEEAAKKSRNGCVKFSRPSIDGKSVDFSFSGIKTAVLYHAQALGAKLSAKTPAIAAGFQEACVDALVEKSVLASSKTKTKRLAVGGGVSANNRLREKLKTACDSEGIELHLPPFELCTDNAAMIAALGYELYKRSKKDTLNLTAEPNLSW
ncbi:MAG: tRNA (adenosine(37)-N6)-threonylcarbamoyltransferase complex transferase subunit TsaD, partial [Candidatus Omnitrophota bacterium]